MRLRPAESALEDVLAYLRWIDELARVEPMIRHLMELDRVMALYDPLSRPSFSVGIIRRFADWARDLWFRFLYGRESIRRLPQPSLVRPNQ